VEKFRKKFTLLPYEDISQLDDIIVRNRIDVLYAQKSGANDGVITKKCRTVIHAVFRVHDPHGDVYAYISEWLSLRMTHGKAPWVPYIVTLPDIRDNLRLNLKIPENAVVFGRHGGPETFQYAPGVRAVIEVAKKNPDIYFLFLNTKKFCEEMPNIIHLPATSDKTEICRFINTCDAMIHARKQGETFGLAVAEFSLRNKPVITNSICRDRAHIHILGKKGIYYRGTPDLKRILTKFRPDPSKDWNSISGRFDPGIVMQKFKSVFLA
jgi:hypothetical protein